MAGRDPGEAVRSYTLPLRDALHCVTQARLVFYPPSALESGSPLSLTINDFQPVRLRGVSGLTLRVGQLIIILESKAGLPRDRFSVNLLEYFYELAMGDREMLAFHWTPDAAGENAVRFPHLHIGRALVGEQRLIRPDDFHKIHVPTGRVSLEAVLRLAITEFQVEPLRPNWEEIIQRTELAYDR